MGKAVCKRTAMYQHPKGYHVQIAEGDELDRNDPLVRRFPDAFDTGPARPVERATAAPGEQRPARKKQARKRTRTDADG